MTLGGSWAVISRVISRVTIVITYIRGLITPLITTHEPPSMTPYTPYRTPYRSLMDPLKEPFCFSHDGARKLEVLEGQHWHQGIGRSGLAGPLVWFPDFGGSCS